MTSTLLNRELASLAFNRRVLAQAASADTPLLERLRFICIVSSNLDEFFEIRVAGLKEQIRVNSDSLTPDGIPVKEAFLQVSNAARALITEQYALLNKTILPSFANEGIRFLRRDEWNEHEQAWLRDYFFREVMPVLTPIGLDASHPFPRVLNKSLNFAVELEGKDAFGRSSGTAIVQAPRVLPRIIALPFDISPCAAGFVLLSSIVHAFVGELFAGMNVKASYQFRVTRNSDLFVDEEEIKNLRIELQGELPQRNFADAVRLEVAENCPENMANFLLTQFDLTTDDLYRVDGPVNLVRLMSVLDDIPRPELKYPPFKPSIPKALSKGASIFSAIAKGDILLHHPYQSFAPVIEFLEEAEKDAQVVAIKMTIYRTGIDSVLMDALLRAAQKGKEVTVVVELLARFDEATNINWAARLEEVGAHVVYGVHGHKTHAKMLMVVRKETHKNNTILRRYVHLGTGNYHPRTARLYSDFGLLTCNENITNEVAEVFTQITGLGRAQTLKLLWQAPFSLHANLLLAISDEIKAAKTKKPAKIIAKMNSLVEPKLISALYEASNAGVKIELIVRGICALRPNVAGLSENIRVRSIIGRFLEHHRVFYFYAGGQENVYLSSADWMDRNFFRRIELAFPILDKKLKKRVIFEGLKIYLTDNKNAWQMRFDGSYHLARRNKSTKTRSAQMELLATM